MLGPLLQISDTVIEGNAASEGGGLRCWKYNLKLFNSLVIDNEASDNGGAISVSWGTLRVFSSTIAGNTAVISGGGAYISVVTQVRWIHDSIFWGNTPDQIVLNAPGEATVSNSNVQGGYFGEGNIDADPLFTAAGPGLYFLSQTSAGQSVDSPCLNAGSDAAAATCRPWNEGPCLDGYSTRIDQVADNSRVDMGYHYPALSSPTVSASLNCNPSTGTLPFVSNFGLVIANQYDGQLRRVAGHVDVTLGNGQFFPNWRAGFTNLQSGQNLVQLWPQNFPALPSVVGDNVFLLDVADVTPAPYNQPPYPSAGDTATDGCTVSGCASYPVVDR